MKISWIIIDWFFTNEGEDFSQYTVGKDYSGRTCEKIIISGPDNTCEKTRAVIYFSGGGTITSFNINSFESVPDSEF